MNYHLESTPNLFIDKRYYKNLRCTTYDIVGRTYNVVTYDIQEYRRYDVTYDIVGVTYDVVVTDLRYRR